MVLNQNRIMPSPISVKIPVTSWMKKYLEFQSENPKAQTLVFALKHEYNIFLLRLVSNYKREQNLMVVEKQNLKLDSVVKIQLPFSDRKDVYFYNYLSREAKQKFRAEVELDMLYDFKRYLKVNILKGVKKKIAIREFFEKRNISEDDIKYESFERKFSRYMDRMKHIL